MAYNNINKLLMYQKVIDIVNKNYKADTTTYVGIYRNFVYPVYPISYNTFLKIIETPVNKLLKEEYNKKENKNTINH